MILHRGNKSNMKGETARKVMQQEENVLGINGVPLQEWNSFFNSLLFMLFVNVVNCMGPRKGPIIKST
ncbi:hypothetical protein EIS57_02900 [Salmonella enterica]|nr:hypothetical protein [Salmonella enterica]